MEICAWILRSSFNRRPSRRRSAREYVEVSSGMLGEWKEGLGTVADDACYSQFANCFMRVPVLLGLGGRPTGGRSMIGWGVVKVRDYAQIIWMTDAQGSCFNVGPTWHVISCWRVLLASRPSSTPPNCHVVMARFPSLTSASSRINCAPHSCSLITTTTYDY